MISASGTYLSPPKRYMTFEWLLDDNAGQDESLESATTGFLSPQLTAPNCRSWRVMGSNAPWTVR